MLCAASKLGVFEKLVSSSETCLDDLAEATHLEADLLSRLLDALVATGYVKKQGHSYALGDLGKILHSELSHAPLLWGEEQYTAFSGLWWSIKEGKSYFEKLYGLNFFDYIKTNKERLRSYQLSMREYAQIDQCKIPEIINFSVYKKIIDVGGGLGFLICSILKMYPSIEGVLFETKEVIDLINELGEKVPKNLQVVRGDFFKEIPKGADAVVLCKVLHDWDDKSVELILGRVNSSLGFDGVLYIVEIVKPDHPTIDAGFSLDLSMLCITGGKERSLSEFQSCLQKSGFHMENIVRLNSLSIIEARKFPKSDRETS